MMGDWPMSDYLLRETAKAAAHGKIGLALTSLLETPHHGPARFHSVGTAVISAWAESLRGRWCSLRSR